MKIGTIIKIVGTLVILIVLCIFIVPQVIDSFEESNDDAFVAQIQSIVIKVGEDGIRNKSFTNSSGKSAHNNRCNSAYDIKIYHTDFKYSFTVDLTGNITEFNAQDDNYEYSYVGDNLKIENISNASIIKLKNNSKTLDLTLCE